MDESLIKELDTTRKSIRKKFFELQEAKSVLDTQNEQFFRPITEPLKKLVTTQSTPSNQPPLSSSPRLATPRQSTPRISATSTPHISAIPRRLTKVQTPSSAAPLESSLESSSEDTTMKEDLYETPEPSEEMNVLRRQNTKIFQDKLGEDAGKYFKYFVTGQSSLVDKTFGIRREADGTFKIGNKDVIIDKNDIFIGEKVYPGSDGLFQLLILAMPDKRAVTKKDLEAYKEILTDSSVARQHFNPNGRIRSSGGTKYINFIKPLLQQQSSPKIGKGLIYWNDPNELVKRLDLLFASQHAGNTSLGNEILDIENQLRLYNLIW